MKIMVRVKHGPSGLRMQLRKPTKARRYWTETPEEADSEDIRIIQLLKSGDLIPVNTVIPKKNTNPILTKEDNNEH